MNGQDRQFLQGMWSKVKEKEETKQLAEAMVRQMQGDRLSSQTAGSHAEAAAFRQVQGSSAEKSGKHGRFRRSVRGATEPTGTGMAVFCRNMFRIGLGQLYVGMADVLCISLVITLSTLYLLTQYTRDMGASIDIAVFTGSPVLYASVFLLFWLKDTQNGTYGLQMSCKYTFFHVLAARMLATSLLGLCFNGVYVLVLFLRYQADGVRLMAISFSSLTCFSVLLMVGLEKGRRILVAAVVCVGWVVVNLTALFCFTQSYGELLRRVPVYLFLGAGLAGMCLYFRQLAFLTTLVFRKEYTDVAN